jgi:hypothetical protein
MELPTFRALLAPEGQRLLTSVTAQLETQLDARLEGQPAAGGAAEEEEQAALAVASRLRRLHPPELVAAAVTQARLRLRARAKFGADAAAMYFTPDRLEQATRHPVAALRARRYAGFRAVADLCCGIGGDLIALARTVAGQPDGRVTGVDRDPLTVAIAGANAAALGLTGRVDVQLADVQAYDPAALSRYDGVFCDPARRTARGRIFDPAQYWPAWDWVVTLLRRDAGVKVAPGIPHALVPAGVETEWVSVRGEVKEAVLWSGRLAGPAPRRATVLPAGASLAADGSIGPPPVGGVGRYLYEPDGAVVRAHLVAEVAAQVGGRLLDPTIAYVTSDALVPTPFATAYEVTDAMPFGVKRLRAVLRSRGVGRVTVKKRGSAITPEGLQRQLRLSGDAAATVVLTRCRGAPVALLTQPVPASRL